MQKILTGIVAAAALIGGVATASAAGPKLYHDKYFWQENLKEMSKFAAKQDHPFDPTPYATDQYQAFIASGIQSGTPPKLFTWWNGKKLEDLVSSGAIQPLDDVWQEMVKNGQMDPSASQLFKVDGKIYGVPLHLSYWVVFYNKHIFEKEGVEPPKTWDDLLNVAATLKKDGITPFDATVQDGWRGFVWFEELLLRTNPTVYNKLNNGEASYTDPAVKKVFDIWRGLYDKGYFTKATSNEEVLNFARGKAAMYLMGDWAIQNIVEGGLKPGKDFGAFIMPNIDPDLPPAIINEGSPIVVSKTGADDPAVMNFAKWWMSSEAASEWAEDASLYVGNVKAKKPNVIVEKIARQVQQANAHIYPRYWEASPSDIVTPAVEQFNRFMVNPTDKVADEVMANVQKIAEDYWSQHK